MATSIEWTEETWNPFVGCSIVSPGCTNCYAMRMATRLQKMIPGSHYDGTTRVVNGKPVWTGLVKPAPKHIWEAPLKMRGPTMWFVNSMSDLFHEEIPVDGVRAVWSIMQQTPEHTYQILTKRAERMYRMLYNEIVPEYGVLHNVWIGVSAERQEEWNQRIQWLAPTPAAVRFVSVEPMLGYISMAHHDAAGIHWVIIGGESGPGARTFRVDEGRSLIAQCQMYGVKVFMKQLGSRPDFGGAIVPVRGKGGDLEDMPDDMRVREMPV